jgi:hypothetical protein
MGDRVEAVSDRDDARLKRNPFSLEPARIAFAVPPFVMSGDTDSQIRIKRAKRLQNFSAPLWMRFHSAPLFRCELG